MLYVSVCYVLLVYDTFSFIYYECEIAVFIIFLQTFGGKIGCVLLFAIGSRLVSSSKHFST